MPVILSSAALRARMPPSALLLLLLRSVLLSAAAGAASGSGSGQHDVVDLDDSTLDTAIAATKEGGCARHSHPASPSAASPSGHPARIQIQLSRFGLPAYPNPRAADTAVTAARCWPAELECY
eukprot:SAG22_NODE_196_length_15552_cov_971.604543_6_plen_123_part_00